MNLKRIDHVALSCSDASRSKDWYCEILGMEWIYRGLWDNQPYFVSLGDARLALFQAGSKQQTSKRPPICIDHFALLAESRADYEDAKSRLDQQGIPYLFQDHEVSHSIYFRDPDGHRVEITTYDVKTKP